MRQPALAGGAAEHVRRRVRGRRPRRGVREAGRRSPPSAYGVGRAKRVHSQERDLARAREIALDAACLRTTVGSVVHGLSNPGTDDRDEMGVCIEPPEYLLGFRRFEHFVYRTQPEGHPSGPGDLDLVVYGLRKFCGLALKGSPTTLLPLFVDGRAPAGRAPPAGAELRGSRRLRRALRPAAPSSATWRAAPGADRRAARDPHPRALALHGYDTKYAMHALRIAYQGIELLSTGRITLPVPEPERSELRRVRAGEVPLDDVLAHLDGVSARLEELAHDSSLPAQSDVAAVDDFLVRTYRAAWDGSRCIAGTSPRTRRPTRSSTPRTPRCWAAVAWTGRSTGRRARRWSRSAGGSAAARPATRRSRARGSCRCGT